MTEPPGGPPISIGGVEIRGKEANGKVEGELEKVSDCDGKSRLDPGALSFDMIDDTELDVLCRVGR